MIFRFEKIVAIIIAFFYIESAVAISYIDAREHLSMIRTLSSDCISVVEIGAEPLSFTPAILEGLAEKGAHQPSYLGIDLKVPDRLQIDVIKEIACSFNVKFVFWPANDTTIQIEPTDMLLINSLHAYVHLSYELETFSPHVKKYICIYQTSSVWENKDESSDCYQDYIDFCYDKKKHGLWPAITDFLDQHPEWILKTRTHDHNGFTVLERISNFDLVPAFIDDPKINDVLENRLILCTGPALDQGDLLKKTIEADLAQVRYKSIFISTQDPKIYDDLPIFDSIIPHYELFLNQGKQLDCTNCIFNTLRNAVNDPYTSNEDIILFKHETLFINDMHLFKQALMKLNSGIDMVVRFHCSETRSDAFFVKALAIRKLLAFYPIIKKLDTF